MPKTYSGWWKVVKNVNFDGFQTYLTLMRGFIRSIIDLFENGQNEAYKFKKKLAYESFNEKKYLS